MESDGIRELLKRMKPDNIRDLIATNALYRPGPLGGGMVDAYVNRKHGREKPTYQHPLLEEVLSETYGVMVYQEQVMRVLNRLGGIELASAYACIKAISKKKQEIIDQRKVEFINGAQERGVNEKTAHDIFDLIIQFAGYGFNKSHSAAYALLGYQTAYLKAHYTAEFMAALLTSEIEDSNKRDIMVEHIADARRLGVEVLPPDVQTCEPDFTVSRGKILFGLTAIKGLGRGAAQEILRARQKKGPFKDFFDFCERIDHKQVPKAGIEKLIKAGAFDSIGARRSQLMEALGRGMEAASQAQNDRRHGQGNLFESFDSAGGSAPAAAEGLKEIAEWPPAEKLKYEKEALDFYVSSHPLAEHGDEIERFATHTLAQVKNLPANQEVFLGGMLTQVRYMDTKRARNGNTRYVRCKLGDLSDLIECVMWPDDYLRYKDLIAEDRIVFVAATVERTRDEPGIVIQRVLDIEQGKKERTTGLVLLLNLKQHQPAQLDAVARVLERSRGNVPVFLHMQDAAGNWLKLKAGDSYRINPATLVKADLETILGPGRVEFSRQSNGNGRH